MNIKYKIFLLLVVAGFSSCKKWLDVAPKTQIKSEVNFENEKGFQDALTGAYLNMAGQSLYGKELSYGFIEVLAKNYTQIYSYHAYYNDAIYNYAFAATKSRIDAIWNGNYFTIANLNNLIATLETTDKGMFEGANYNVIKGEAYGLRAFNHFDLLRLFAPSPAVAGGNVRGIPYRTKFENGAVPVSTVTEVIAKIIADLELASALLKDADPIVAGSTVPSTTTGYLRDRSFKFNYYAVRALMARVYLYSGDKVKALECAKEVIDSQKFPATLVSQIVASDKIMSSEMIFGIYRSTLATEYDLSYSSNISTGMYLSTTEWATVYETAAGGSADYRYLYQTDIIGFNRYSVKFRPSGNTTAANRLLLMRVSELYDIAAECLIGTDPAAARGYLNTVRSRRNLQALSTSLTPEQLQQEVFKEYRKDFITEGQLFFYYKRLNLPRIEFLQNAADAKIYVLPMPDNEIEFGN